MSAPGIQAPAVLLVAQHVQLLAVPIRIPGWEVFQPVLRAEAVHPWLPARIARLEDHTVRRHVAAARIRRPDRAVTTTIRTERLDNQRQATL